MAQNSQTIKEPSKTIKDGDMIDLTSEHEVEEFVDDDVIDLDVLDATEITNMNKIPAISTPVQENQTILGTSVDDGDIILLPSPLEVRKRKFPIDPLCDDNDDDVIFLSSAAAPPMKTMAIQQPQVTPQIKSVVNFQMNTKRQPASFIQIQPVGSQPAVPKTQLGTNSGQKISFQRTLVKQPMLLTSLPHQISITEVTKNATPNKNVQCSQNKPPIAPEILMTSTGKPTATRNKSVTNKTATQTLSTPVLPPTSKLGKAAITPKKRKTSSPNPNIIAKKNSTVNNAKRAFANSFSPRTQSAANKLVNKKLKVAASEHISQEELAKAVRSISTSDSTPENERYVIINYQNVESQQKKVMALNSKPSPIHPNVQTTESAVSNIVIQDVFSNVASYDSRSNMPPRIINTNITTKEKKTVHGANCDSLYNFHQSLILKRQTSTVTTAGKVNEATPSLPVLKDPLTGEVVRNKQLQKCFADSFDPSSAKNGNANFSGILLNSNQNAENSNKGKVFYLLYPVDEEVLKGDGKIVPGILGPVGQIGFQPTVVNRPETSVSFIPPPTFTPVDINQIINRGKNLEEKDYFVGFKRHEMIKSMCCRELEHIIKTEEKKIDALKEVIKAHHEINFVQCSVDSTDYLPEFDIVKIEPEDEDVIFIGEEVKSGVIPSKVVSKVSSLTNQVLNSSKTSKKNPLELTKTKEALELIKKGLQIIQNMPKEDVPIKNRRGRPKKAISTQITQSNIIGGNVNKKEKVIDGDDLLLLKRVAVVTGKRRGRRRKTEF